MKSNQPTKTKKVMKKTMRFLCMAALTLVGAVMSSCSSDDNSINEPVQPVSNSKVVTLTATVSMDGNGTTRALTSEGVKTFAEGDRIAVIYTDKEGNTRMAASLSLTQSDITNNGKSATFIVSFDDPDRTKEVTYVYPSAMVKADGTINYDALASQDGTLSSLASSLDYCTNSGAWNAGALPTLTLKNQLAICAYTIKNSDGTSDFTSSVTDMTINDGTNTYTISRSAAAGPIYVAIRPTTSANISYTVTAGANVYEKTVTDKTYAAGTIYPLGLRMTQIDGLLSGKFTISNDLGTTTRQVYFSKGNLQAVIASGPTDTYNYTASSWKFADNQWDYIGSNPGNTSFASGTTVDLFGWVGASASYDTYGLCTLTSSNNAYYGTDANDNLKSDWGTTMGPGWFTLKANEWGYLFTGRTTGGTVGSTSQARYTMATIRTDVGFEYGVILFPDGVDIENSTDYFTTLGDVNNASYYDTRCTSAQWTALENKGCVFLPAAGNRNVTYCSSGSDGYYWSSSSYTSRYVYYVKFYSGSLSPDNIYGRDFGMSVRLVREVE